ncbi:MAG: polysaccharide deacetylase family protein [Clostridia bacterium]|nr:polysaccharide deacetylase family protein [Clostridia bacterium]
MRIALTFDDGPNTVTTPQVLDILEKEKIVGSFFLIADSITPESAEQTRRAKALGCDIENHSRTHGFMDRMTPEQIREEVRYCTEKIVEITGEAPTFFRPPFIAVNQDMYDNIDLTFICGAGCEDWVLSVSARERAERVLAHAEDGQIVLLHDLPGNINTVEALKIIIPELKKRGFEFVTVSQLFELAGIQPVRNRLYSNVYQTTDDPRNPSA